MSAEKLGYATVNNTTAVVKSGPAGFFALVVTGTGDVTVYDNTVGSGTVLYAKTAAPVGENINFGSFGMAAKLGLTVVTTGIVNVVFS